METLELIYWIFAIPFSIIFIIQFILALLGFGDDQAVLDSDFGDNGGFEDHGLRIFSIRNIIIFFTVFGWAGITSIKSGLNVQSTIFVSFGLGFLMMYFYAKLFQYIMKLTESGTMEINNAIDKKGTVYLSIPEKRTGTGKVNIEVQGAVRELDAVTDGEKLATGEEIIVIDILDDSILIVKKYQKE